MQSMNFLTRINKSFHVEIYIIIRSPLENNIPTLYILELHSLAAKNATISNIQCPFVQKKVKKKFLSYIRVVMVPVTQD